MRYRLIFFFDNNLIFRAHSQDFQREDPIMDAVNEIHYLSESINKNQVKEKDEIKIYESIDKRIQQQQQQKNDYDSKESWKRNDELKIEEQREKKVKRRRMR